MYICLTTRRSDQESRKLEKKVEETEAELITFLQSVIRISSMTFSDKDVSHRAQLRHLIDVSAFLCFVKNSYLVSSRPS